MEDIVIASNNQGKINDFKAIFPNKNVIGISELIKDFDVEETGTTFEENAKLKEKNAVIFGNEGRGICDEFVSISDCKTVIPILSNTESLNVAVASAIILYKFREIEGLI